MSYAEITLAILWVGVTAYAVFGGADFGAGFWDLVAGGPRKGKAQRDLIEHSIAPVWEANHVWIIFALIVLWTGFKEAFAAMASTLYIPLTAVAIGVILRGAGFAFRKAVTTVPQQRAFGAVFALSSVITPYFLGTVAGAVASGRVPLGNATGDVWTSWNNPTSWLGGVFAVLVCAEIAAVFLAADAQRRNLPDLVEVFRLRALITAVVTGAVALVGIAVLHADAPKLFHGLTHRGAALIVLSVVAGLATLLALWERRAVTARVAATVAVGSVVWGWAVGQYPDVLVGHLTVEQAAGPPATMEALIWVLGVGSALLVPSLYLLFRLAHLGVLEHDDHE